MALKHAISILMSRFSLTYKTLLYSMIVILLFALIGIVVLVPMVNAIDGIQDIQLIEHIKTSISNLLKGDFEAQNALYPLLHQDIVAIGGLFENNVAVFSFAIVWIVIVIMLFKIMMTMSHYPIADVVHNFMAYNSRFGFTSNFVSNLGISAKFALSEFIVSIPYYLVTFGIVFGLGYAINLFSSLVAVIVCFGCLIVLVALKKSLLAFWLPHLIYTKGKVWQTFKEQFAFVKEKFVKIFGLYVMTNLLMVAFVAFFGLFTFTIGWFVGYAMCVVLGRIIDMVIYYRHLDHKYYIEPKKVIDAKSEIL